MKARKLLSILLAVSSLGLAGCNAGEATSESSDQTGSQPSVESSITSSDDGDKDSSEESVDSTPSVDYSISQITTENTEYTVRGVVAAKDGNGIVIADDKASIYAYGRDNTSFEIGTYVEVSGTVKQKAGSSGNDHGLLQFSYNDNLTVTEIEGTAPTLPAAVSLTSAIADGWATAPYSTTANKLYTWTATAAKSGNYITLNIDGSNTVIEPTENGDFKEGTEYEVSAYFIGFDTKYDYASVVIESAEATGETEPAPELDQYSIGNVKAEGENYTVRGIVDAKTNNGLIITDGVYSIFFKLSKSQETENYDINDYVEISGTASPYAGMLQFSESSATITVLEEIPSVVSPTATQLTAGIADSWNSESFTIDAFKKYTWTSVAGMNGNYKTLNIAGSNTIIEPSYMPSDISSKINEGWTYTVTAYFAGYYNTYAMVYITDITDGIQPALSGINIMGSKLVGINNTTTLTAIAAPVGAGLGEVTWSSENQDIATVDENGTVTGVSAGSAVIRAKSGNIEGTFTIEVTDKETKNVTISFDADFNKDFTSISEDEMKKTVDGVEIVLNKNNSRSNIAIENNVLKYIDPLRVYQGHLLSFTAPEGFGFYESIVDGQTGSNEFNASNVSSETEGVIISDNKIDFENVIDTFTLEALKQYRIFSITFGLIAEN